MKILRIKFLKIIIFLILLFFILFIGFVFTYLTIFALTYLNFSLIESSNIVENIYTVRGKLSNFYIIEDKGKYICIDAGDDIEITKKELTKLKIKPELVTAVFLTHTDFDHTKCLTLFRNAEVYILNLEEQMINGKTKRSLFTNNFKNLAGIKYKLLNDEESYNFDTINLRVIYTPGHTPGSCSYLVNDNYLFTGDLLSLDKKLRKVKLFPFIFTMDSKTMRNSINKLKSINTIKWLFTCHHGYSSNFNQAIKDFK